MTLADGVAGCTGWATTCRPGPAHWSGGHREVCTEAGEAIVIGAMAAARHGPAVANRRFSGTWTSSRPARDAPASQTAGVWCLLSRHGGVAAIWSCPSAGNGCASPCEVRVGAACHWWCRDPKGCPPSPVLVVRSRTPSATPVP